MSEYNQTFKLTIFVPPWGSICTQMPAGLADIFLLVDNLATGGGSISFKITDVNQAATQAAVLGVS